jgi:endonuclease/exonuclease/phosphatase family metal-dependent hydrolase
MALLPDACAHDLRVRSPLARRRFRGRVFAAPAKPEAARRAVRAIIKSSGADVLALQEVGSTNALLELREALEADGVHYPHWEHVRGRDSNLHLAFLSKFPIVAVRHHTKESFLKQGRRFQVARGFGESEVEIAPNVRVTLMTAHLKSKRQVAEADQEEVREEEAALLREKVEAWWQNRPEGHLIVLGDFNDGPGTRTVRTIMGRGKTALHDTRPAERPPSGGTVPDGSGIVWTHYYAKEETYSRIDFILVSPSLRERLVTNGAWLATAPDWRMASDHRLARAAFRFE